MDKEFIKKIDEVSKMRNHGDPEGALEELKELRYAFSEQNPPEAFECGRAPMPARVQQNFALLDDAEGRCHQAMENFSEARKCFEKALVIRRSFASEFPDSAEAWVDYAYSAFQIAMLEYMANSPREEIGLLFRNSEPIIRRVIDATDDVSVLGNMYQNLAFIKQFEGNYNKAISLYHHSLLYRKEADDKRGEGLSCARIGECYAELGEHFAMEYLIMAKNIFVKLGDIIRIEQVDGVIKKFDL